MAAYAFFEELWELGVRNCFVNLGSDHPSIMEAMAKGIKETPRGFPKIYTCPNEMAALSMANGYARMTNTPQCVIIHVDVGTSGMGAAIHNPATGRAPVFIFACLRRLRLTVRCVGLARNICEVLCNSSVRYLLRI